MASADTPLPNPDLIIVVQAFLGRDQVSVSWCGRKMKEMNVAKALRFAADLVDRGRLSVVPELEEPVWDSPPPEVA